MKVRRVLIYEGSEEWIRQTLHRSITYVQPNLPWGCGNGSIAEIERTVIVCDELGGVLMEVPYAEVERRAVRIVPDSSSPSLLTAVQRARLTHEDGCAFANEGGPCGCVCDMPKDKPKRGPDDHIGHVGSE